MAKLTSKTISPKMSFEERIREQNDRNRKTLTKISLAHKADQKFHALVLELVEFGMTNREIAQEFTLTSKQVTAIKTAAAENAPDNEETGACEFVNDSDNHGDDSDRDESESWDEN